MISERIAATARTTAGRRQTEIQTADIAVTATFPIAAIRGVPRTGGHAGGKAAAAA